jgi:hypothetical protein
MNSAKKENRKHPRIRVHNHTLIGYSGVFVPAVAINISATGLKVQLQQPPKALPVELNVYLSSKHYKSVCLPAQVAYIKGATVGLQFLEEAILEIPFQSTIRLV